MKSREREDLGRPAGVVATAGLLEAMGTARNMRWFTNEPVSADLIETLLWAATRAASPGNSQGWDFVIVEDPGLKASIAKAIEPLLERVKASTPSPGGAPMRDGSINLLSGLANVPALIFVCGKAVYPPANPRIDMMYSAVYGAVQNLLLAARALGLGAAMTTFHSEFESEIRLLLDIPDDVHMAAMIPVGWPARSFGPVKRKPLNEVVHRNNWGSPAF
jgi:nitroreductase